MFLVKPEVTGISVVTPENLILNSTFKLKLELLHCPANTSENIPSLKK